MGGGTACAVLSHAAAGTALHELRQPAAAAAAAQELLQRQQAANRLLSHTRAKAQQRLGVCSRLALLLACPCQPAAGMPVYSIARSQQLL